jgi:hypothetical protein
MEPATLTLSLYERAATLGLCTGFADISERASHQVYVESASLPAA